MTQYLVAIHHPDDYDPSIAEDETMDRDIDALNDEMKAAGVRIFVGGLQPASSATSLRVRPDGKVLITDGPYIETKEHVGGFWVLEVPDLNEALAWGARPRSPVGRRSRCARFTERPWPDMAEADAIDPDPTSGEAHLIVASLRHEGLRRKT